MEENTGSRIKPYEDFAGLFPPASDVPERAAAHPAPADAAPAAASPAHPPPGAGGSALNVPREQVIVLRLRTALPGIAAVLALLAVTTAGVALWLTHEQTAELDALRTSLTSLQAELANGFEIKREVTALTNALQATQSHLAALDEAVAQQISSASQPRQLRDLAARLDTLTAAVEELHARAADTGPAASTRITPNSTLPTSTETWAIRLGSFSKQSLADAEVGRLRALDIPAEKRTFKDSQGKTWHRVFVRGFETRKAAENARAAIQTTAGISRTWLERVPAVAGD